MFLWFRHDIVIIDHITPIMITIIIIIIIFVIAGLDITAGTDVIIEDIKMKIGGIPNKGKRSFSTYLFMKWKRIELGWRRWCDPKMRKEAAEAMEKRNPFNPINKRKR